MAAHTTVPTHSSSVVFLFDDLADWQRLAAGVSPGTQVVVLDGTADGLGQIADYLRACEGLDAVHILSHGQPGGLQLGSLMLDQAALTEHADALAQIGAALGDDGDILLYGCDVAQGETGMAFLDALSRYTGIDVAASDDLTGASSLGGDWQLETANGVIETQTMAFDYAGVLAVPQVVGWPSATVWVRPGEASYSWTWGVDSTHAGASITQVAFWEVPDPAFGWFLEYGYFQYSTDGGQNWTAYDESNSTITYVPTAGTVWQFVNTNPAGEAAATEADRIGFGFHAGGTEYGTSGFYIYEDAAPTDITITSGSVVSDMPSNGVVATLKPADTGLTTQGTWVIESQSHSGLFALDFDPAAGNTASLIVPDPTGLPADGGQVSVTLRYYDLYQTDSAGQPIAGQGVSKTFTFDVKGASNDLEFTADVAVNDPGADTADQTNPSISAWADGRFVVAWADSTNGGVFAQLFDGQGVAQGGRLSIDAAAEASTPSVVTLADGKFAVVYVDTSSLDIQFRIVDSGSVGEATTVAAAEWDPYSSIGVTHNGAGDQFLVSWNAPDYTTTKSAVFNDAGVMQGTAQTLSDLGYSPAAAILANGSHVMASVDGQTWEGIRLVVDGTLVNPSAVIGDSAYMPGLAALSGGGFVLAWGSSDETTVYAQTFDNQGIPTSALLEANTAAGNVFSPMVAALSDGGFVVSWNSEGTDGSGSGISGRRFSADGTPIDAEQFQINQLRYGEQSYAVVTSLDDGRFAVAWVDSVPGKTTGADIEARVLLDAGLQIAPVLATPSGITLTDTSAADTFGNATGTLSASDDDGIASFGIQGGTVGGGIDIGGVVFDVSRVGEYGTLYLASAGVDMGKYVYVANAAAINALAGGSTSETFTVTATDGNASPASGSASLVVNVTGANDAPTDIGVTSAAVGQSAGINAVVGTLSAVDADTGQTHVYSFASGAGDTDNGLFNISGAVLRANDAAALAPGNYSVRIQASDGNGGLFEKVFTLTAADDVAPTVTSINRVGQASTNSAIVVYTVSFAESVTAVDAGDFSLTATGTAAGTVAGVSGSGSTYAVTVDGVSGNGTLRLDLKSSGTAIVDASDNAIAAGYTSGQTYTIDTQPPIATIVAVTDNALSAGESSLVTIAFSEAVSGFTSADLTAANGTLSGLSSSDGGITWTATFTPDIDVQDTTNVITLNNAGVTDAVGNAGSGTADSNNFAIDTRQPTAAIVVADTALAAAETSMVTITFSEAVTGFTSADMAVANGTLSGLSSSDGGITWTATFTPSVGVQDTTNLITLNTADVADAAGNVGNGTAESNNYAIDTQRPTATIIVADNALSSGETSLVTITFSEAVSGFSNSDLSVANGALSDVASSDGGITWTAIFTPVTDTENAASGITLDNTGVTDAAGNSGSGATSSNSYAIDTLAPANTVSGFAFSADSGASTSDLITNTATQVISGTLSTGLAVGDTVEVSLDNGATWVAAIAGEGDVSWSLAGQSLVGSGTLMGRLKDAAGNLGAESSQAYILDTTAPTFVPASSSPADDAIAVGIGSDIIVQFSEGLDVSSDLTKVYLREVATDTLVPATFSLNGDGHIVINPTGSLGYGKAYYVSWDVGALQDVAGNVVAAVADEITYNFTVEAGRPPAPEPEDDEDGIGADEENSVPGLPRADGGIPVAGDGNGDGIADGKQGGVASLQFRQTGQISVEPVAPMTPLTLVADSRGGQADPDLGGARITYIEQQDAPADMPTGLSAPLGLLAFTASVDAPGVSETFSLFVDSELGINGYFKKDASGVWVNLADPANGGQLVNEHGKTRLDFVIEDGGAFDADGKADGIVTDPGILGVLSQPSECAYDPFRNDADHDQVPDDIEAAMGSNANTKDNDVFGDASQWVNQLWRDLYGREGHGDSRAAALASQLEQGSLSRIEALSQVLASDELDSHAAAIIRLYHAVMDRSPDSCGYNFWLDRVNDNVSLLEMGRAFLNAPEFVAQHGELGNDAFVDFLYQGVLDRAPDAEGGAWWLEQLEAGTVDRGGMLFGMTQSAEFKAAAADEVAVDLLYLGLLNREPDANGASYWQQQYPGVGDLARFLAQSTAASSEYHDRFLPADGHMIGIVGEQSFDVGW